MEDQSRGTRNRKLNSELDFSRMLITYLNMNVAAHLWRMSLAINITMGKGEGTPPPNQSKQVFSIFSIENTWATHVKNFFWKFFSVFSGSSRDKNMREIR